MEQYIKKSALIAEIERLVNNYDKALDYEAALEDVSNFLDTLEVKEVDLEKEIQRQYNVHKNPDNSIVKDCVIMTKDGFEYFAKHFYELGLKVQHDNWKVVDNTNLPQADRNKIYCVFTKDRYILATVINHPKDEELLQWKCTEFPFHRYDMCEGDKYMQIV
jgi:hypothetical protein